MTDPLRSDPAGAADDAASALATATGVARHDVALVLGTGWASAADRLGETVADLAVTALPHFPPPAAIGHPGRVRSVQSGDVRVLVFVGRTHLYEGHGIEAVVHAVRTAAAAGCRTLVLTNGSGGLDLAWVPGTPVLISDHINLTAQTPLRGATFIDLSDLYSARLRTLCRELEPDIAEGVYAQFRGPQFETPAEVRMAGILGAQLVGMSTAVEAIAAREAGLELLGLSLVTNAAAGLTGDPIDHQEVLASGHAAADELGQFLARLIPRL